MRPNTRFRANVGSLGTWNLQERGQAELLNFQVDFFSMRIGCFSEVDVLFVRCFVSRS